MLRATLAILYQLSWSAVVGLAVFLCGSYLAAVLHEQLSVLPDDDWSLFIWPVGCVFGWWFAYRSLNWHRFHFASLVTGAGATAIFMFQAIHFWRKSQALTGVKGPFSGLEESIAAFACVVASLGAIVIIAGSVSIICRNRLVPFGSEH